MKSLFPALLAFALAAPALAAESDDGAATTRMFSGNEMLPHCKALVDDDIATPMSGLRAGVISTVFWSQGFAREHVKFCAPKRVITRGQTRQVVLRYLENHPEKLHLDIRLLALEAMREAWPCKSWWQWW